MPRKRPAHDLLGGLADPLLELEHLIDVTDARLSHAGQPPTKNKKRTAALMSF